jgi:hypothetical protein
MIGLISFADPPRLAAADFLRGDANGDGVVSVADAQTMVNFFWLGHTSPSPADCPASWDADGDGTIGHYEQNPDFVVGDLVYLLSYFVLQGTNPPPAPFPTVGPPDPALGERCDSYGGGSPLSDPEAELKVLDAVVEGRTDGTAFISVLYSSSLPLGGLSGTIHDEAGVFFQDTSKTCEYAHLRGDLDGNGRPDLVVGASHLPQVLGDPKGEVFIVHDVDDLRGDFKITDVPRVVTTIEGEAPFDRFGNTVRVLGDQDGDRIPKLLVEATYYGPGDGPYRGKTFLIPGSSLFLPRPSGFRRGDVDANGTPEITDAVRLLGFLFLGEARPPCLDAGDADDTGELDISDPMFILSHLFLGGPAPPAPGPTDCGSDPTADNLPECLPAC